MKNIFYAGAFLVASSFSYADVGVITNQDDLNNVLAIDGPAVIDVYANWCKPCKAMAPIFLDCSNKNTYASVAFFKMNVDTGLAGIFNVMSIPTFLFINKGTVIKRVTGKKTKSQLEAELDNFLGLIG